uniref:Uncharacterized protein n=1 Tax=Desertifilum tharense IPPAS B-1220 TaxID=1781255 RepID=A0ACD5GSQ6_9CYAN
MAMLAIFCHVRANSEILKPVGIGEGRSHSGDIQRKAIALGESVSAIARIWKPDFYPDLGNESKKL